jgi:hypothetical protein
MDRTTTSGAGDGVPTVILIGGSMTDEDGIQVDSRQPVQGDPWSESVRRTLAGSLLWWLTVSSLVNPALDSAGNEAFALILETRTIAEVRPDGTLRRRRLRSLFPGGTSSVRMRSSAPSWPEDPNKITVDIGKRGTRWRFLEIPWYLRLVRSLVNPAITVDTRQPLPNDAAYKLWHETVTSDIIVMPHTASNEEYLRGYFAWLERGRPYDGDTHSPAAEFDWAKIESSVPRQADFRVTGLFENGEWTDPTHLDAARSLLQSRFDLRIGLWDLARNPVLQETLLTPIPVDPPSTQAVEIPTAAVRRNEQRAARTAERREAVTAIFNQLAPLRSLRWEETFDPVAWFSVLPLAPRERAGMLPPAWLSMQVNKNESYVAAMIHPDYNDLDLTAYLRKRRHTFEGISASFQLPGPESPASSILWRIPSGWAAHELDWSKVGEELVAMTEAWLQAFDDLAAQVLTIYKKRHRD